MKLQLPYLAFVHDQGHQSARLSFCRACNRWEHMSVLACEIDDGMSYLEVRLNLDKMRQTGASESRARDIQGSEALVPKGLAYESAAFISTSSLSSFSSFPPNIHSFDLYPQTMSTW